MRSGALPEPLCGSITSGRPSGRGAARTYVTLSGHAPQSSDVVS